MDILLNIRCFAFFCFPLLSLENTVLCLFWAPQIAVNRLIFSYFYFLNKQPISNFQHILCFWASVRPRDSKKRSEASTDAEASPCQF